MVIEDAKTGNRVKVDKNNRLATRSIAKSAIHEATKKGDAYSWNAVTADMAAGGTALCVVNTSFTRKLVIDFIYAWSDVPTGIKIHCPAACTWAGTAVVGNNLNRTSNNVADAVAYANESGTTLVNALVVLTLQTNQLTTDQFAVSHDFDGSIVLGYNQALAADIVADSAAFNCTIIGYYID